MIVQVGCQVGDRRDRGYRPYAGDGYEFQAAPAGVSQYTADEEPAVCQCQAARRTNGPIYGRGGVMSVGFFHWQPAAPIPQGALLSRRGTSNSAKSEPSQNQSGERRG